MALLLHHVVGLWSVELQPWISIVSTAGSSSRLSLTAQKSSDTLICGFELKAQHGGCMTFGQFVAEKRKEAGLSQKQLAAMIKKEDGQSSSPQYLNDIEHDRRSPPAGFLREQFRSEE